MEQKSAGKSITSTTLPAMERIGTVKVMHRATPVGRARANANLIDQSGFVVQLERRLQVWIMC